MSSHRQLLMLLFLIRYDMAHEDQSPRMSALAAENVIRAILSPSLQVRIASHLGRVARLVNNFSPFRECLNLAERAIRKAVSFKQM